MAIFPGELGLASFIGANDDGSGGNSWSCKSCKAPVNRHHQQTNTQLFTGRMPFLSPNQQCQSTEGRTRRPYYFTHYEKTFKVNKLSANDTLSLSLSLSL